MDTAQNGDIRRTIIPLYPPSRFVGQASGRSDIRLVLPIESKSTECKLRRAYGSSGVPVFATFHKARNSRARDNGPNHVYRVKDDRPLRR